MHLGSLLSKRLAQFKMDQSGWAKAVCPFHKDTKPSFFINMRTGYAHCFGCGLKMGLQELLDRLGIRSFKAEYFVKQQAKRQLRDPHEVNHLPDYILGAYKQCPIRLLEAGFDKQLLEEYEVGFDKGLFRITFPIRDIKGGLAAVSGRNLQGQPKYQIYTYEEEFPEYSPRPKDNLYNLHRVAKRLEDPEQDNKPLYVVEGFKACLWMAQHGYDAVALVGAQMTRNQKRLLSRYDVPLALFLDNDGAGRAATVVNYLELSKLQFARVVEYPEGAMQPDDLKGDLLHKTVETPQEFRHWYAQTDLDTQHMRR